MKRPKTIILIGIILLLTGCTDFFMICSLNPFYLDKNIRLLPEIEGRWSALPIYSAVSNNENGHDVWKQMDSTAVWTIERVIAKETRKTKQGKDSVVYTPLDLYYSVLISFVSFFSPLEEADISISPFLPSDPMIIMALP